MAAVITTRLCPYVEDATDFPMSRIVCWKDNSLTLHCIRGTSLQWKLFVANPNPVREIKSLLGPSVWRYCPKLQNPADIFSRVRDGLAKRVEVDIIEIARNSKPRISNVVQPSEPVIDFTRLSKHSCLLRNVAWRFIHNFRVKDERIFNTLPGIEIQEAEHWLIVQIQETHFSEKMSVARHNHPLKESKLTNSNPFPCSRCALLRVGHRIRKSL